MELADRLGILVIIRLLSYFSETSLERRLKAAQALVDREWSQGYIGQRKLRLRYWLAGGDGHSHQCQRT